MDSDHIVNALREKFRGSLTEPGVIIAPGATDVLTARLIAQLGFDAVYVGGYGLASVAFGLPDTGLVSIPEMLSRVAAIVDSVEVPVIADLDDAGGTPLLIRRHIRMAERAGVAALHIEDLDLSGGKHLGSSERLRPVESACANIKAAVDARQDDDLVLIARTDAVSTGAGLAEAIDRLNAYVEAGADMVFASNLRPADVAQVVTSVPRPLMNTFIPDADAPDQIDTSEQDGLALMVHSSSTFRAAYEAVRGLLLELKEHRTDRSLPTWQDVRKQIDETVDAPAWRRQLS